MLSLEHLFCTGGGKKGRRKFIILMTTKNISLFFYSCLRMCNVGQSGDRIGTVEKNDLVCLSNWNVIMYCARAGLRTIN